MYFGSNIGTDYIMYYATYSIFSFFSLSSCAVAWLPLFLSICHETRTAPLLRWDWPQEVTSSYKTSPLPFAPHFTHNYILPYIIFKKEQHSPVPRMDDYGNSGSRKPTRSRTRLWHQWRRCMWRWASLAWHSHTVQLLSIQMSTLHPTRSCS